MPEESMKNGFNLTKDRIKLIDLAVSYRSLVEHKYAVLLPRLPRGRSMLFTHVGEPLTDLFQKPPRWFSGKGSS